MNSLILDLTKKKFIQTRPYEYITHEFGLNHKEKFNFQESKFRRVFNACPSVNCKLAYIIGMVAINCTLVAQNRVIMFFLQRGNISIGANGIGSFYLQICLEISHIYTKFNLGRKRCDSLSSMASIATF